MQLTSSKRTIAKIVRDLNLGDRQIPWQDIVEWIAEGLQHIGAYGQLVEQTVSISISNFKGKLPGNFFSARPNAGLSFKVVHDTLHVGIATGCVSFTYLAFPIDEEGFPLVPDNVSYHTALFWKVAMQLSIRGQLLNKELSFALCKQRWDWYCRQAGTQGQVMDGQFAQRVAQLFTARIPVLTSYYQDYNVVNGEVTAPVSTIYVAPVLPKPFTPHPF